MEDSIFTKIIKGEIPCYKVHENDKFLAFLDINPRTEGHTLVVPKEQIDSLWELDNDLYHDLWDYTRFVAGKIETAIPCARVGLWVEGLEVPHVHVHLVPMPSNGFAGFTDNANKEADYLRKVAEKIRES